MNPILRLLAIAAICLLAGCSKPSPPASPAAAVDPPKPARWEYKVSVECFSSIQDAVLLAKNDLSNAQHGLAIAKVQEWLAEHRINDDAAGSSNVDANVAFDLAKDDAEFEREEGIRTNLTGVLNAQPDWELVSAILLPGSRGKAVLIFKRPVAP